MQGASAPPRCKNPWAAKPPFTDCLGSFCLVNPPGTCDGSDLAWLAGTRKVATSPAVPLGADHRGLPDSQGAGTRGSQKPPWWAQGQRSMAERQLRRANPQAGDGDPHPELPSTPQGGQVPGARVCRISRTRCRRFGASQPPGAVPGSRPSSRRLSARLMLCSTAGAPAQR